MKRFIVVLASAGALMSAAAAPAFADAGTNNHNCEGAIVSESTPLTVTTPLPGDFGQFVSGQAQSPSVHGGGRDDFVAGYNDLLVNCGSTP